MSITVKIVTRSEKLISNVQIDPNATVLDLKQRFSLITKKYGPERQRLTLAPKKGQERGDVLKDEAKLSDYELSDGTAVYFKDLGLQVGWTTVFFWEYFGPLAVYPLFYFFPQYLYPGLRLPSTKPLVQQLALAYWSFHYTKRILETFLVHRYSKGTMPVFNLFKNCTYYWGFTAFISYFVNHPLYTAPPELQSLVCFALAMVCQASNFYCHILQRNLRKPGDKEYHVPYGFLFNYITCANYTTEIWGWILFTIGTQTVAAGIFTAAGLFQMTEWAIGKHKRLRKMFDGKDGRPKYPRRWVIFPPFL